MRERLVESRGAPGMQFRNDLLDGLSGGTFVAPTYHSFTDGPVTPTGNPLDVAIQGDGFFTVQVGNDIRYTRDGRFTTNEQNELIMVAGGGRSRVLDEAGVPIVLLPASAGTPRIEKDGTIRQGDAAVGKIGLVEFADRNTLGKVGANLFRAGADRSLPAQNTALTSGAVESSTVDPVQGLAEMIEVTRAYQLNAQMISLQDMTIGQAVSRVGRIG
jgi:flagellar basal-body rod protein FlgF